MRSSLARVALSKIGAACSPEVVRKSEPCSSLSGSDRSGYEFGARTSAARASGRPAASRCSRDPGQKPIPDPDPETRSKPQPWVIQIVVGGESRLSLTEFSPQGHSVEQLEQLIGDWGRRGADGVPVAICWSLASSKTKAVVIQGTAVAKGVWGSRDKLSRWVGAIDVEPGQYQFRAMILSPVPQLASISARLELWNIFFKMSGTWQSSAILFGALFTVWIVTPVS